MKKLSAFHKTNNYSEFSARGIEKFIAEIEHTGLVRFRKLVDSDKNILSRKVKQQFESWDDTWNKMELQRQASEVRSDNQRTADDRTNEAKKALKEIDDILLHTLKINDSVNWNKLKDHSKFEVISPIDGLQKAIHQIPTPRNQELLEHPPRPLQSQFSPSLGFWDSIFSSAKKRKLDDAASKFNYALENWSSQCEGTDLRNKNILYENKRQVDDYEEKVEQVKKHYNKHQELWKIEKKDFENEQNKLNLAVDQLKLQYNQRDPSAILEYIELVLNNSKYPDSFPQSFELEYNPESKLLIVDYSLPAPNDLPTLSEVKFIATKKELRESYISESQIAKMYDLAVYNIALRTIHEIFESDTIQAVEIVAFNGWVNVVNRSNGKRSNSCIVSIQVVKREFEEIDLAHVDPKACFKSLKGVGSSRLSSITAIQPLLRIDRNDRRFVNSHDVTPVLDEGYNLATMNWEEFEHLIREVFEKEFSSNGGEVKVTQASRDGGVDAVAFDPDPIRGGKIVIQAKRYTNTVGVSAVRDLYGTVLNEGATKGILVTTADYGPDAYEFAKNKPLTLMNGGNLLFLLGKHGHKARINIKEARENRP